MLNSVFIALTEKIFLYHTSFETYLDYTRQCYCMHLYLLSGKLLKLNSQQFTWLQKTVMVHYANEMMCILEQVQNIIYAKCKLNILCGNHYFLLTVGFSLYDKEVFVIQNKGYIQQFQLDYFIFINYFISLNSIFSESSI